MSYSIARVVYQIKIKFESCPPYYKKGRSLTIFEAKEVVKIKLGVVDDFRTANWVEIVKYPDLVYQKSVQLLPV